MGHDNYLVSKESYGRFMPGVVTAPLKDREVLVLRAVMKALDVEGIEVWNYRPGGMLFAKGHGFEWYDDEFYRYLLAEVCEYEDNGGVKGMALDLCNDFYDLCTMNKVYPGDYSRKPGDMEYVITMSSGGGTVRDFMTLPTREEAEEICEDLGWVFMDENEFEWSLDIEEREVSLDGKLDDAKERSDASLCRDSELGIKRDELGR